MLSTAREQLKLDIESDAERDVALGVIADASSLTIHTSN